MKRFLINTAILCLSISAHAQQPTSPNGKLTVRNAKQSMTICSDNVPVLQILGVSPNRLTFVRTVKDEYRMLSGKKSHCVNEANEYESASDKNMRLRVRLYNDGIAFRYEYDNLKKGTAPKEQTAFRIAEGTRRWMMHWTDSYEDFYPMTTSSKQSGLWPYSDHRFDKSRWGFPSLLQPTDSIFVLLTEANIEHGQSAASLYNDGNTEIYRLIPDGESSWTDTAATNGTLHTPWRVAIIGTLADVVESTLVTDVSEPSRIADTSWIKPGVVSWIYWAYNHGSNDYDIICRYVDMAAKLPLPYVLIDAEWDEMRGGHTIEEAINYAKSKGVRPLIWYNSSVGWVNGAPGPKFRLNKAEDREREFAWCERMGIAGVKIDFFSGDNQQNMDYCQELLECAARHHLLVNFHGATIPRGWQRTWPNLLSTEGVYGAEWYNNVPTFTERAARHNATLPFTRNVIGPMDYTPCTFSDSQHPHITTHAHELALTVLFESGLQHLADRPESYYEQPWEVQQFLSQLPSAWDETRLLNGYPGESVVMARRSGDTWYVAGVNGRDEEQTLPLPLNFLKGNYDCIALFSDAGERAFNVSHPDNLPTSITCRPRGGFVCVISCKKLAANIDTEFVMQLKVTLGQAYSVGETPHGKRTVIPITGGTFEGPLLRGTILNGGADWQLANGSRTELEAIYSIRTNDGVNIHIRNRGIIYNGKNEHGQPSFYFKAAPQFEAPKDSRYAWLNNSLFLCTPDFSQNKGGITLNIWKVK